jgi:hypothetical protein
MAFRRCYQSQLAARTLTVVFRPGDRRYPAWRGYAEGEFVTARVITRPGSDARGIAPLFNDFRARLRIEDVRLTPIALLTPDDFTGSSPDVRDAVTLRAHLEGIYGRPLADWGNVVTRIRFAYA